MAERIEWKEWYIQVNIVGCKEKFCAYLILDATDKVCRIRFVEWNDDYPSQQAPEKSNDPLRAVPGPDQYALAFYNASGLELTGKLKAFFGKFQIRQSRYPQTSPVDDRGLVSSLNVI